MTASPNRPHDAAPVHTVRGSLCLGSWTARAAYTHCSLQPEIAAVLIGSRVQTQMIFAGAMVAAEGAACLNFFAVKRSVVEDKPAPSGGFQNRQLLISQTARPLSEK